MVPREPLSSNPSMVMSFPSDDEIFAGIIWRSMIFFLVGSIAVAYCTVPPKFRAWMFTIPWVWLIFRRLLFPFTGLVTLVSVSNVSSWEVVKKPEVPFIISTWTEPWDSHLSLRCPDLIQT